MNIEQVLDSAKIKLNIESDYALAKHLDISQSAISKYRKAGRTLDVEVCVKLATILDVNALILIAEMEMLRAHAHHQDKKVLFWNRYKRELALSRQAVA
jgi:transcriptional regulator with XRE-family HTH domain